MSTEIKAPTFPESIADGTLISWNKKLQEECSRDEIIAEIETDKVVLEVVAPSDGFLSSTLKQEGDTIQSNEVLAMYEEGTTASANKQAPTQDATKAETNTSQTISETNLSPSARKIAAEKGIDTSNLSGSGKDGRIIKEDVLNYNQPQPATAVAEATTNVSAKETTAIKTKTADTPLANHTQRTQKRVPMTRLRARVAERLVQAQQNAAMLTTFNEVNMQPIMQLRSQYQELFIKKHDTKLGFMSFFIKACTEALKLQPDVNAAIDNNDIVYNSYQDIGVAVSSDRGLVVPILRNAEHKSLANIEKEIKEFSKKAKEGKLSIDDMTGGTFTISNGGVFGSLLSTPIINPPQSAILGMHKIQERPVAVNGKVEILPMMYLALSYDHRLLDGKEAVTFLVKIKEFLEDPTRIILQV